MFTPTCDKVSREYYYFHKIVSLVSLRVQLLKKKKTVFEQSRVFTRFTLNRKIRYNVFLYSYLLCRKLLVDIVYSSFVDEPSIKQSYIVEYVRVTLL